MDKLDVLDELLPDFQQFLSDLTTCKLSSALETKVEQYNKSIQDYCATILKPAPEPPKAAVNGNIEKFLAEERARSRMSHTVQDDTYYNVHVNTEASKPSNVIDENYEEPTRSPTVPSSNRPPITRIIDDLPEYEDPDEIPARPTGKSATMPLSTRYTEPSDSGGTLMSFNSSSSSQPQDDLQNYEDLPDYDNFDDGDDGEFSSTDYEDYDEDEIGRQQSAGVDSNANKAKTKLDKAKLDQEEKLAHFKKQHESDPKVDHLGLLFIPSKVMTISKKNFGQWTKRYCLARDTHLLCYKNHDTKRPSQDLVLFGYTVAFVGQEGKQQNVFSISHPSRGSELYSADSKEDADKWIGVLQGYATMGNELVPSTGYVEKEGQGATSHTGDELSRKVKGFLGWNKKKSKESNPQLNVDGKGVLSGCINIMGAKYGEPKWRKKYLMIKNGQLECWSEDGETQHFDFPLNGTDMMPADPKVTKRKVAMKISRGNETLIYLETLNHLDMGPLLKIFMEAMTDSKKDPSSSSKTGMVSSLLKAFEKQNNEPAEQEAYDDVQLPSGQQASGDSGELYQNVSTDQQNDDDLYEDTEIPIRQNNQNSVPSDKDKEKEDSPTKKSSSSIYQNFKIYINIAKTIDEDLYLELLDDFENPEITSPKEKKKKKNPFAVMQRDNRKRSETLPAKISKMPEEPAAESGKKDKKAKKKEDKKKKDKKGKGKEEVVVKEEEVVVKVKEPPAEETPKKKVSVRAKTAFAKSDKMHLLDVDRLEIERKEVDTRKREVTRRKIDLRAQKRETTDPKQKELLEIELQKAQQEWSECSNRLAFINTEIESLNKRSDATTLQEQKQQFRMSMVRELSFKDPMMVRRTRDRLSLCAMRSWSLDSASPEIIGNGLSVDSAKKDQKGSTSPGMKVAQRGGNVKDKLQMFQQMGNK
ncbi:actin filament-associated protein 1-like 2 isoform X3 [Patiria miniata]|uniref:PH domain-containing protein n=1 Tax=Patiria miniata TaxID=46514 RepID=A0A914BMR5_PATMI|nr:actin filament-associated protein 1-like 2 isoform X3 [Patiria miniata]